MSIHRAYSRDQPRFRGSAQACTLCRLLFRVSRPSFCLDGRPRRKYPSSGMNNAAFTVHRGRSSSRVRSASERVRGLCASPMNHLRGGAWSPESSREVPKPQLSQPGHFAHCRVLSVTAMLRRLSLLNTQPELIECTSLIRLRMPLRHEQKTLPPVLGERAVAIGTCFIRPRRRRPRPVPGC